MAEDFPKKFHCPNCGSEKTVMNVAATPLKASGRLPLDAFCMMDQKVIYLEEANKATGVVPAIKSSFDVCFDCGTWYCTMTEKTLITLPPPKALPGMKRPPGMPPI